MKHRILFILPSLPWPLASGGLQALFNGVKAMDSVADIYIMCTLNPQVEREKAHEELKARIANIKGIFQYVEHKKEWSKRKLAMRICAKVVNTLFKPTPSEDFEAAVTGTGLGGHSEDYYRLIREIIERYNITMVQVEMLTNIDAIMAIPAHVKKVFVHHELGFVRNQLLLEQQSQENCLGRLLCTLEKTKEISLLNQYDAVITLSTIDRDKLVEVGVTSTIYPSFAVVSTSADSALLQKQTERVLSFVGPEFHTPNKLGMEWFLTHVWIPLKKMAPDYKLNIIGVWSKQTASQWTSQYPDIHFLGFVDDLAEALAGSVMIVPIFVGSGIRMKILEAMSIGVPFVTTTVGAEGIPVTDGQHCVIADTPEAYMAGILKLEDAETRELMIRNGRQLLMSNYSFEKFKSDRLEIFNVLIN